MIGTNFFLNRSTVIKVEIDIASFHPRITSRSLTSCIAKYDLKSISIAFISDFKLPILSSKFRLKMTQSTEKAPV